MEEPHGRYVDCKHCLHREKAAMVLPLESSALALDPMKHPEQAERLEVHSATATTFLPVQAKVEPAALHLEPEAALLQETALARTTLPHFLVVQKCGCFAQVAQAD
jgi:hypothetical protein